MNKAWGEPTYYAFLDYSPIYTALYDGLPRNEMGEKIFILEFAHGELESPGQEPIGVYHYAGIRRYLWREQYWNEYNIDYRYFMDRTKELLQSEESVEKAKEYRKLLDMLKNYATGSVTVDRPVAMEFGAPKLKKLERHWRVVYKIDQKQG